MQRFLLVVTCLLISSTYLLAQPPDTLWTRTFGGVSGEAGFDVQPTSDGGFIVVGRTHSFGAGGYDVWLIKTDSNGEEEWNQAYGDNLDDAGRSVQQTSDGGYIIAGETESNDLNHLYGWLIKTDSTGIEEWNQIFGEEGHHDKFTSIHQTNDGGYIIAGNTDSYGAGGHDIWLVKTDSIGIEEWNQTFGGATSEWGNDLQQTNDGGFIICGTVAVNGDGDNWADGLLIKTDSTGTEEWSRTYGGEEYGWDKVEEANSVQQTSDGGYVVTGETHSFFNTAGDVWLFKTDSTGDRVINSHWGGVHLDFGNSVQETSDGGFIIAGITWSFGAGNTDAWLIKTDSYGSEEWNQTLGGDRAERDLTIRHTADGGYVIAGSTSSIDTGNNNVWLIRLAAEGVEVDEPSASIPTEYEIAAAYPNPFNSTTRISVALPEVSDLRVSVFNIIGQEVAVIADANYSAGYHNFTFDAGDMASGVYFVQASVPGRMNNLKKIVLIR